LKATAADRGGALARRHAWGAAIQRKPEGWIECDRRLIQRELADDNRIGPSQRGGLLLGAGRRTNTKEDGYSRSEFQTHRVTPTIGDVNSRKIAGTGNTANLAAKPARR